jgi:hypothetical protein
MLSAVLPRIIHDQAPPPLNVRRGIDAVIVSTDNTLV